MATILIRKGTGGASSSVVPAAGEPVFDTGTNVLKIGNGSAAISALTAIGATASGTVNTSGSPVDNDWAKFTDADTIEGRSNAEFIADLSLEIGVDVQAYDAQLDTLAGFTAAQVTRGIADNNLLTSNGSMSNNGWCRVDGTEIESVTTTAVKTALGLTGTNSGDNTVCTSGAATTAATLLTTRAFQTNLASTSTANFNGSAANSHGVTGTLAVGNGGTGVTASTGSTNNVLSASPTLTGTLTGAAATFSGNVSVAGNLDVIGATTNVTVQSLLVEDSWIQLDKDNTADSSDALDSGWFTTYDLGMGDMYAGCYRDRSAKSGVGGFAFFMSSTTKPDAATTFTAGDAAAITKGVWEGTTVGTAYGGTGSTSTAYCALGTNVSGQLPVANGGTALTTLSTLLNSNVTPASLSLEIGVDVQAYNSNYATTSTNWSAADITSGTLVAGRGGTGLTSTSTLLNTNVTPTSLSLLIGTNTQAYSAKLDDVVSGTFPGGSSIATVGTVTTGTISGGTF